MPSAQGSNLESSPGSYYFNKVLKRIQGLSGCQPNNIFVRSRIHEIHLRLNKHLGPEAYKINSTSTHVEIEFSSYSGYVYALQTLEQMVQNGNSIQLGLVEDEPIVSYRGIMIDPVRHFIGVKYLRRLIQAMPLSKLNMLHWLFSNDQAFVLELINHPQLAQESRYSEEQSYSIDEVKELIALAKVNAVSIIPEFDTPGHVRSWGLGKPWADKNITILCPGGEHYNHQFDVSKDDTYKLAQDVLKEGDNLFKDSPFIHLGGDEVFGSCWDLRPAIKTFMALKNIKNYG